MKHYLPTQEEAIAAAELAHQHLIAIDQPYAASVTAGKTTCWCNPVEDEGGWFIWIDPRLYELFGVEVEQM